MRFFRKLLRASGRRRPRVIVTDKLRSYAAAQRIVMPGVVHRQHRYLTTGSRIPISPRVSGRDGCGDSSPPGKRNASSRCTESSDRISDRDDTVLSAADYRQLRSKRFRIWNEVTRATALA